VPALRIQNYLWLDNGYKPDVEARLCYSGRFLYVRFEVAESKIRARFMSFQDPVYKDSCVEFFVDPFPDRKLGYINFETNALGTMLVAIGRGRKNRVSLTRADFEVIDITASIKAPIDGPTGGDFWTLCYRLPLSLFEKYYGEKPGPGLIAKGNFTKCGDETEFPHYGAWSIINSPQPDFHRPEYFGKIVFT